MGHFSLKTSSQGSKCCHCYGAFKNIPISLLSVSSTCEEYKNIMWYKKLKKCLASS